jgi:polysaccharide deacetylase 2 family uncharacterized protein YibQ
MRLVLRYILIACAALAIGTMIGVAAGLRPEAPAPAEPVAAGKILVMPAATAATTAAPRAVPVMPALPAAPEPAWLRNAVVTVVPPGRLPVAIVIDDMGVDRARSERIAALSAPLTLAFLPYARGFEDQIAAARGRGHEILVHMPMEPVGREDPGPGALTVALEAAEIRRRLGAALDRAGPVVGINNHMGSRFTVESDAMRPVLEELQARGLLFLDSRTAGSSVGVRLAQSMSLPHAARDVFLDNDPALAAVEARLAELEAIARRQGHAVAIGHPHDGTIAALGAWLPTASARGLAVVPVSAIVRLSLERQRRG